MANKEKMGPPTLEMIQGNPYNYTFDEVAKCMGEERAKSLFKTLYKNGVSPKNQTMTIKDIYVGGDTTKYAFELQDGYCIETVCIKRRTGNTVCVSTMVGCPVGCIFCASGKNVLINLLQYNETACKRIKRPNKQQLVAFKIRLEEAGLEVKLRESRGNRIKAACGQLVSDYNKGNDAPTSDSPEKMSPVIHKLSDNKADTTRGIRKEKRHPFAKHKAKRKRKKN